MVKLVEGLSQVPNNRITNMPNIQHLYAFALNRYVIMASSHLLFYYNLLNDCSVVANVLDCKRV